MWRRDMKKILLFVVMMVLPIGVYATTFDLKDTDMHITFDEDLWYVFTPDNIENNSELEDLGISYDYMVESFQETEAYLDAILFFADSDDFIEIFVRKSEVEDVKNLANYEQSDFEELGEALAEKQNASYEIYQKNYPYIKLVYQDQGFYLNEYYTIVNGYGYTITAQKPYEFTNEDALRVQEIVDSITFDVDETLKEPSTFDWKKVFQYAIIGALAAAFVSVLFTLIRKNKKNED